LKKLIPFLQNVIPACAGMTERSGNDRKE